MIKSLSVFFPAFNEEDNIRQTVEKAATVLKQYDFPWEVIVVDDGSRDKTGQIADEMAREDKRIRVIHQPNGGYGMALRAGFQNAKYDWVTFTDADGQFDFSEINKFIERAETSDLVMGYRIKRSDPAIRLIIAFGWKMVIFLFFGHWFKDIDCAFKLIKHEVLATIPPLESTRGGMISPELVLKAQEQGYTISQVGVHHYPRLYGKPTGANVNVILTSFKNLLTLWWKLRILRQSGDKIHSSKA
jgi:glycosyltransferase involved in cell wall biosynthesis